MRPILLDYLVCPDSGRVRRSLPRADTLGGFRAADLQVLDLSWRDRNRWRGHGRVGAA